MSDIHLAFRTCLQWTPGAGIGIVADTENSLSTLLSSGSSVPSGTSRAFARER